MATIEVKKRKLRRKEYSLAVKVEIIDHVQKHGQASAVARFECDRKNVSKIFKNRERYLTEYAKGKVSVKRLRTNSLGDRFSDTLLEWFNRQRALSPPPVITVRELQAKAQQLYNEMFGVHYCVSRSWIDRWKKKHEIHFKRRSSSANNQEGQQSQRSYNSIVTALSDRHSQSDEIGDITAEVKFISESLNSTNDIKKEVKEEDNVVSVEVQTKPPVSVSCTSVSTSNNTTPTLRDSLLCVSKLREFADICDDPTEKAKMLRNLDQLQESLGNLLLRVYNFCCDRARNRYPVYLQRMDYIRSFDIRLDKDVYYAGEMLAGFVMLENSENIKIRGIRVVLRGKAHAQMKVTKSGERRTVRDDQYLLDDKAVIWGKDKHEDDGHIPILPRSLHQFPFSFQLPQSSLPCSLESKLGTIRYYIKVVIDIPYASSPQGIKYFTIIGPHIDCMEEKYLNALIGQDRKTTCCLCCQRGALALRVTLERTAYVCGENIRLHAQVENQTVQTVLVRTRLLQFVEYFIDKGVLGETKAISCTILEHKSAPVAAHSQGKCDSTLEQPIKLPVVPPTLIGVCRLIQIYYVLKVCLEDDKCVESLSMDFPLTVATVPFRITNSVSLPPIEYDFCAEHAEGGKYISPEFRMGQVYDGKTGEPEGFLEDDNVLLYRPVYVRVADRDKPLVAPRYSVDYSTSDRPSTSVCRSNNNGILASNSVTPTDKEEMNSNPKQGDTDEQRQKSRQVVVDLHQLKLRDCDDSKTPLLTKNRQMADFDGSITSEKARQLADDIDQTPC